MIQPTSEQMNAMAQEIDMGCVVYYRKDSGDIIAIPDGIDVYSDLYKEWKTDIDNLENEEDVYISIKPLTSFESFNIMEDFAREVDSCVLKLNLLDALHNKKPFQGFKNIIDREDAYRQAWFDFKNLKLEKYVLEHFFEIEPDNIGEINEDFPI